VTCLLSARFFVINTKKNHAPVTFFRFNQLIRFVIWCENKHRAYVGWASGSGNFQGAISLMKLLVETTTEPSGFQVGKVDFGLDNTWIHRYRKKAKQKISSVQNATSCLL